MKRFNKQHGLRRCTGGRDDQRGSAILLVLVAMVLMAILAGSLLQLTRFERIPRSESNIEVVIASVVDEIVNQLTDDLLDNNGNFLNTQYTTTNGGGDEPWDFPYTNTAVTGVRVPIDKDGNNVTGVVGGVMDDPWLADHMPDFRTDAQIPTTSIYDGSGVSTAGLWRKITSLTGLYLGGTDASSDLTTVSSPNEYPVNFSNFRFRDRTLRTNQVVNGSDALLVDADGDGIGDSRWEWAPLRQVGSTQYVMAVRIVDLSARMDANVASRIHGDTGPSATSFSGANLGLGRPRGDSPVDLDGSGFVAQTADATAAINGTTSRTEWLNLLRYRVTGSGTGTTNPFVDLYDGNADPATTGSRLEYWTNGASRVSNTFDPNGEDPTGTFDYTSTSTFGLTDAFELLQGNGLNSPTNATIEDLMPVFLRRNNGQENGYGSGAGTPPNSWTAKNFWELDPRKNISPFTGSSVAVKPTTVAQARELKIDVNEATQSALGQLRNRITNFLNNSNSSALVALYPHLGSVGNLSNQLTACIADYIDDDNNVTTISSRITGFEALPYITEIYTQRIYNGTVTTNAGDLTTSTIDWAADAADTVGYVIEIGNPFAQQVGGSWVGRPISLDDVYLGINGTRDTNELSTYAGKSTLDPGEVLIIYRNSTGNDNDGTQDTLSNYLANTNNTGSANITPVPATLTTEGPAMPVATSEFSVTLHATEQSGTPAGWSYNACDIEIGGATLPQETIDATNYTAGTVYQTYVQTSYRGVGEGLQMMTVVADPDGTNGYHEDISTLSTPQTNTTVPVGPTQPDEGHAVRSIGTWFDNESKDSAPGGFSSLENRQIPWPDNERERLHWIGDLLQIPLIGPNRSASGNATNMANAFAAAAASPGRLNTDGVDALYLPYQRYSGTAAAPVVDSDVTSAATSGRFGVYNYPHAVLLLEQLTTFSPASDGENGDGSSPAGTESVASPNDDEVLVPGRLNLNTAPRETLVRLLPFPDLTTRQNIADAIIARRENIVQANANASGGYATGANGIPAIAYTAALYEQIENLYITTNATNTEGDTTTLGTSNVRVDLNDYEDRGALGDYDPITAGSQYPGLADGVADDREEEIMLAKWLSEVADTRSDVFAAYIVVQGYPIDNFTEGTTESARLIVIFSRAGVKGTGDKAVEIGRFRIN